MAETFSHHRKRLVKAQAAGLTLPSPLTIDDCERIVASVGYKPGWAFRVEKPPMSGGPIGIGMQAQVPCAYHPEITTVVRGLASMEERYFLAMDADRLSRFVFDAVMEIERHEAQEHFLVNGERVYDPHRLRPPGVYVS